MPPVLNVGVIYLSLTSGAGYHGCKSKTLIWIKMRKKHRVLKYKKVTIQDPDFSLYLNYCGLSQLFRCLERRRPNRTERPRPSNHAVAGTGTLFKDAAPLTLVTARVLVKSPDMDSSMSSGT